MSSREFDSPQLHQDKAFPTRPQTTSSAMNGNGDGSASGTITA